MILYMGGENQKINLFTVCLLKVRHVCSCKLMPQGGNKYTSCFSTESLGLDLSELLFLFSSCCVVLQWCAWTDLSPFGMCTGTIWVGSCFCHQ